jgi:hypothetical protein
MLFTNSCHKRQKSVYLVALSAEASKLMLLGMAPVEAGDGRAGGGDTRRSVTLSLFTSWLELCSDADVSPLFTDSVLSDTFPPSLFFSTLDELMLTMLVLISDFTILDVRLFTRFAEVEMVAELMRVIRSVMVDRESGCSVSTPESYRRSYCDTDMALKLLSLELRERSMRSCSWSYGFDVEGRSYLDVEGYGRSGECCAAGKLSSTHWLVASDWLLLPPSSVDSDCALLLTNT